MTPPCFGRKPEKGSMEDKGGGEEEGRELKVKSSRRTRTAVFESAETSRRAQAGLLPLWNPAHIHRGVKGGGAGVPHPFHPSAKTVR